MSLKGRGKVKLANSVSARVLVFQTHEPGSARAEGVAESREWYLQSETTSAISLMIWGWDITTNYAMNLFEPVWASLKPVTSWTWPDFLWLRWAPVLVLHKPPFSHLSGTAPSQNGADLFYALSAIPPALLFTPPNPVWTWRLKLRWSSDADAAKDWVGGSAGSDWERKKRL